MTNEEAIKKLKEAICYIDPNVSISYAEAFEMAIEALKNEPQWISVKDRLPELIPCNAGTAYSEAVIIITKNKIAMEAILTDCNGWICDKDFWECEDNDFVTHWMPLPSPPKEET